MTQPKIQSFNAHIPLPMPTGALKDPEVQRWAQSVLDSNMALARELAELKNTVTIIRASKQGVMTVDLLCDAQQRRTGKIEFFRRRLTENNGVIQAGDPVPYKELEVGSGGASTTVIGGTTIEYSYTGSTVLPMFTLNL